MCTMVLPNSPTLSNSILKHLEVLSLWLIPCQIFASCNNVLPCIYNSRALKRHTKMNTADYLTFILQSIGLTPATE